MTATVDAGGRIVIPKALREELGWKPGERLELAPRDGRLEVEPAAALMRMEHGPHGAVIVADLQMPVLTVEDVREVLEQVRR